MAFTREQAYTALASLNPAPVFLESYHRKRLPKDLDIYFGPPEGFFIAPDTQELYTQSRRIPILDDGNFGLVTFLDPNTHELVQLDIESPDEPVAVLQHWQQYLASLMIGIGESVDDDSQIHRIAEIVEFAYVAELFNHFESSKELRDSAWWEARRLFPLSIGTKPNSL